MFFNDFPGCTSTVVFCKLKAYFQKPPANGTVAKMKRQKYFSGLKFRENCVHVQQQITQIHRSFLLYTDTTAAFLTEERMQTANSKQTTKNHSCTFRVWKSIPGHSCLLWSAPLDLLSFFWRSWMRHFRLLF